MSAGEVLEEDIFAYYLKAVSRIGWSAWSRAGRKTIRGKRSLVAVALSEICARVAFLVREVGVALFSVFTRKGGICVSAVFASRVFSRCRNRTRPFNT